MWELDLSHNYLVDIHHKIATLTKLTSGWYVPLTISRLLLVVVLVVIEMTMTVMMMKRMMMTIIAIIMIMKVIMTILG